MSAFLDQAVAMARRICRDAIWSGRCCNWVGPSIDSFNLWDVRYKSFGPELYAGTSGVALFLASVARVANEPIIRKTAEGAARHALQHAGDLPPAMRIAVYSGKLGIGWALLRIGELLNDESWHEQGISLLSSIDGEDPGAGLDVLSGCAGAIPPVLSLWRRYQRPAWLDMAVRWGDQLDRTAVKTSEGWSWGMVGLPENALGSNLTGFSHGAAGIGWALLELFEATGESRFQNAANEAFRYERTYYSAEEENWPDFRDYLRPPGSAATPIFGVAWCHGAPGIALSRLSAWRMTGNQGFLQEAEAALRTTKKSLEPENNVDTGFSLCHGCGGNADVLLEADRILAAPDLREAAEAIGHAGIERYEAQRLPWPCGLQGAGETAGLMLGTAGIGYFYLRLADPGTPTVLMIR